MEWSTTSSFVNDNDPLASTGLIAFEYLNYEPSMPIPPPSSTPWYQPADGTAGINGNSQLAEEHSFSPQADPSFTAYQALAHIPTGDDDTGTRGHTGTSIESPPPRKRGWPFKGLAKKTQSQHAVRPLLPVPAFSTSETPLHDPATGGG